MEYSEETLRKALNLLATGTKDKPIVSDQIASVLGINDGVANPKTRKLVLKVIQAFRIAIAANSRGYWVIRSEQEMIDYVAKLDTRAAQIKYRSELVYDCWYERNG